MVLQSKLLCIWSCAGIDVHPGTNAILNADAQKLSESEYFKTLLQNGSFEVLEDKAEKEVPSVGNSVIDEANAIMASKEKNAIKCIASQFDKKLLEIVAEKDSRESVRNAARKQIEQAVTDAAKK
jgi:hypothetical protein